MIIGGGVDLPEELLAAQERGEVVLLCGAGVSQRVGLPSFHSLVRNIYARLRETWQGHPAEVDAMEPPLGSPLALDRALFALAKRLGDHDPAARSRAERRILEAVTAELAPRRGELDAHRDIARLSRDAEMRSRVVTTNFDTLFERAWPGGGAPSRAGADLPAPQTADFAGVLHLHGRIADDALGLGRTPLVLNSAEFGEAYLRSGWAARYIYDLARAATIVIVGYGADDPPMRYILEVLTADRERYTDLKPIYALAPSAPTSDARERTRAVWNAKGATAITYDSIRPDDHDALYGAIAQWADLADNPAGWRRAEAERILSQDPDTASHDDWNRLRWIFQAGGGGQLLADANPAASWAQPLGRAGLLAAEKASPASWIHRRMTDPEMPAAILADVPVDPRTVAMIEHGLTWRHQDEPPLPPHMAKAWRLILAAADRPRHVRTTRWHAATRALGRGDASLPVRREIVACLRPTARPEAPMRWPGMPRDPDASPRLRDVLGVRFGPSQLSRLDEVAGLLPPDARAGTLRALDAALQDALEDAVEYERPTAATSDVRSVARHRQDRHPDGYYPIVRVAIDLWALFADNDPDVARAVATRWRTSEHLLLRRMWLHTLSTPTVDGAAVAEGLAAVTDDDFWTNDARRELMRLLVERWDDLTPDARAAVEARIVAGIPPELLTLEGDILRDHTDHQTFTRLERLINAGRTLTQPTLDALAAIRARHPQWIPGDGDRDDFGIWSSGAMVTTGPQGNPQLLDGVGPDDLVARATEIAERDRMRQSDIWRSLCNAEPMRALAALEAGIAAGRAEPYEWRGLLHAAVQSEDPAVHAAVAAAALRHQFPDGTAHAVLDLLLSHPETTGLSQTQLLALWDRVFAELGRAAEPVSQDMHNDPVFRLLNEAEGKIGTILLNELGRRRRASEQDPVPRPFKTRIERLVVAEGALGHLGRASMMDGLTWFHSVEPDWSRATLVPSLSWQSASTANACWRVVLAGRIAPASLHNLLLPDLLETARRPGVSREGQHLAGWLLLPLLWRQTGDAADYAIGAQDVRQALTRGGDDLSSAAAFWLVGALEELEDDAAQRWRERVGPLLAETWPQESALRSPEVSQTLARLPALAGDAFPEAVDSVVPLVVPLEPWDAVMWLEFDDDGMHRFDDHPAAMLQLMEALFNPASPPAELTAMLQRIAAASPELENGATYRKLLGWARARGG